MPYPSGDKVEFTIIFLSRRRGDENATCNPQLSSLTTIETDGQKLSVFLKNLSLICWKYGVETKQLKRSVRRNLERFPSDFMFELNNEELNSLKMSMRCNFGTSKRGGMMYAPFAFTEQGVAMLSSVLRSDTAIEVNIRIMRAFVAVRRYLATPKCENCQLEDRVKRLADYIEEVLADQNDQNEYVNRKLAAFDNAIAMLQAAVFSNETDGQEEKSKRVFNLEVKGFKKKG